MATEFKLPEIAEGVESADIAEVHVSEGDVIEADQVVLELETEKAVVELRCPHSGKITKVHVSAGNAVKVGETILTIEESATADKPAGKKSDGGGKAEKPVEKPKSEAPAAETKRESFAATEVPDEEPTGPKRSVPAKRETSGMPVAAGPATRRMARELGIELTMVSGSGNGGRITQEDVARYYAGSNGGGAGTSARVPALPNFEDWGDVERQPLSKIARSTAANLSLAWQVIPHVTQHELADITELEAARKRYTATVGKSGPKVTMTAIALKAVVAALKEFPHFNASLDTSRNELVLKQYYHIGVAVDTPNGLLVPVIRDVDQKSVIELAAELTDIAGRARDRKLDLKSMQGGTFTITNLGGIGGTSFTPIVNYPEVAILGMSRGRMQLELIDGEPQPRLMLPLSLSYDHRVINGADAARFIVKLSGLFTDAFRLLIEC